MNNLTQDIHDTLKNGRHYCIANASAADIAFINGVMELFCDPAREEELAQLKAGEAVLHFTPYGAGVFPVEGRN